MGYQKELSFITKTMREGYARFYSAPTSVENKTSFDLVTDVDKKIESYISEQIKLEFPGDTIHGEEFSSAQRLQQRTWTVDPIDGTCNMASNIKMFGVQCSLVDGGEIVVGAIYLPHFDEMIWAERGEGCYCNGEPIRVNGNVTLNNAIVSFGDYPHKRTTKVADIQNRAIGRIYPKVAKIRMFGAACMDFALVAQGKTHCTVVTTTNLWDIAPGIIICQEAGAIITNLDGGKYKIGDEGVVASASTELAELISSAYSRGVTLTVGGKDHFFRSCIFDFDGVVLDTEKYHYVAWKAAFESVGISLSPEDYFPLRSTGRDHIIPTVCEGAGVALTDEQKRSVSGIKDEVFGKARIGISENDVLPGVREFIDAINLRHVKTAVASSSKSVEFFIEKFGLEGAFDFVLDGTSDFPKKPAPDIFVAAAKKTFASAEECLVFEDSLVGIEAAIKAGMSVIAIGGIKSDKALACFDDFSEMISLIK